MTRKPFEPKPYGAGDTVIAEGTECQVWSNGPRPATVWAVSGTDTLLISTRKGDVGRVVQRATRDEHSAMLRRANLLLAHGAVQTRVHERGYPAKITTHLTGCSAIEAQEVATQHSVPQLVRAAIGNPDFYTRAVHWCPECLAGSTEIAA